jgi:crossover junction endodeoxyribonuclease RusA
VKIVIPGRPVPAVRMTQRSKFVSKQAQRYLAYKDQIGWEAKAAKAKLSHAPFKVSAKAYIDCNKPDMDVDNLAKAFLDGLNKIAWHDDRQVTSLLVEKFYVTENERVEIEIVEVS